MTGTTSPKAEKSKKKLKLTGDVCEYAPTGRAACHGCGKKIAQGQVRIGKESWHKPSQSYIYRYWHLACHERTFPNQEPKFANGNMPVWLNPTSLPI